MEKDHQAWWQQVWGFIQITFETWKFLSTIISLLIATGVTGGVLGALTTNLELIVGGIILTLVSGVLIISLIFLTNNLAKTHNVRILDKYVTYRYQPDLKTMEHTKNYRIIALANKVDNFIDRYKWSCTKQGKIDVTLLSPDQKSTHQKLQPKKDGEWSINDVVFDPPLHKGEKVSVLLRWDLYCEGDAQSFLSQIVDAPTEALTLSVTLPYNPENIRYFEFNNGDGIETLPYSIIARHEVDDPGCNYYLATREIQYKISKPKLGHKYMIKWDSPKSY